eukprot:207582_1
MAIGITEYLRTKNNPENHADTWVVDAPLSRIGIDEAYGLSRFLGKHLTLKQFEHIADIKNHTSLSTSVQDVLSTSDDILETLNFWGGIIPPDSLTTHQKIENKIQFIHQQIQHRLSETNYLKPPLGSVVIEDAIEHIEKPNNLEMPLSINWVLNRMMDSSKSIVVTSNLRRTISTAIIALWDRFALNKELIHILPCLQEIGRNVDTYTSVSGTQLPQVSDFEKKSVKLDTNKLTEFYESRLFVDPLTIGKKPEIEFSQDIQQRLNAFCYWVFNKKDSNDIAYNSIIVCGHKNWFKTFFKTFMTASSFMQEWNGFGVVAFRMVCYINPHDDSLRAYRIVAGSITDIYNGFTNRPNKNNFTLAAPNCRKMYKTFIFINHATSVLDYMMSGKSKWQAMATGFVEYARTRNKDSTHTDTSVIDSPLSSLGIDEAYGFSRFLAKYLESREQETLVDCKYHQTLYVAIQDSLAMIKDDILSKHQVELMSIAPELISKYEQIKNVLETMQQQIKIILSEKKTRRKLNGKSLGKVNSSIDDDLESKDEYKGTTFSQVVISNNIEQIHQHAYDDLEMPLEIEWVLDQMMSKNNVNNSIVVTSNLRRAISTAVIALWDRFGSNEEYIHILPCLQELGMNVHAHTPIVEAQLPQVSNFEKTSKKLNVNKLTQFYSSRLVIEKSNISFGKKGLRESGQDTQQRLNFF